MRKRVSNSNTFLRGKGITGQRKSSGRKGVFTWLYIAGWVADEGKAWINGGRKEVAGSPILLDFSSKRNSVSGWKDWGGLLYLHSAWDTPRIKLPHLSTGATSANKFSGNLEAVKGDQMSCLSYRLCSDSEKKSRTGAETETLIIVHVPHWETAVRRRGMREAG